jgi:hypothetical protein
MKAGSEDGRTVWKAPTDRRKILPVLEPVAAREIEVRVLVGDTGHQFTSKLVTWGTGDSMSEQEKISGVLSHGH